MNLPEGYSFKEDDHVVFLIFKGKILAAFSSASVKPKEILKTIAEHTTRKGV